MMKLIIGNKNYSSWSLRPWLLLARHELSFEEIRIPLYTDRAQQELSKYTDAGKVPVLHDHNRIIWDSLAICEYLSEQYLDGRGWPADVSLRAEARSCSAEMHSGFPVLRTQMPMNCRASGRQVEATPELSAEIARITTLWESLRERNAPEGPWLYGEFSIVDCMYAPVVLRFHTYGVPVPENSAEYMRFVLADEAMLVWLQQAREESEIIDAAEVGR